MAKLVKKIKVDMWEFDGTTYSTYDGAVRAALKQAAEQIRIRLTDEERRVMAQAESHIEAVMVTLPGVLEKYAAAAKTVLESVDANG